MMAHGLSPKMSTKVLSLRIMSGIVFAISISMATVVTGCPWFCSCYTSSKSVRCHGDLTYIPMEIPHDTRNLWLRYCNITTLNRDALARMPALETIQISYCNLEQIEPDAFAEVPFLSSIDLSWNNLSYIYVETFHELNLETLNLYENNITDIHFLEKTLTRNLNLGKNPIEELDFGSFPNMLFTRTLSLTNLDILEIDSRLLKNLQGLESLYIGDNAIEELNGMEFAHMKSLKTLDLSYNQIETLPGNLETIFSQLKTLVLHGNPLHCNCEMRWFKLWYEKYRFDKSVSAYCGHYNFNGFKHIEAMVVGEFQCIKPVFVYVSPDATIYERDSLTLVCIAEGDPAPRMKWISPSGRREDSLPPQNRSNYQNDVIMTFLHAKLDQAGIHTCVAENIKGKLRTTVNVRIDPPPPDHFTRTPKGKNCTTTGRAGPVPGARPSWNSTAAAKIDIFPTKASVRHSSYGTSFVCAIGIATSLTFLVVSVAFFSAIFVCYKRGLIMFQRRHEREIISSPKESMQMSCVVENPGGSADEETEVLEIDPDATITKKNICTFSVKI